MSFARRLLLTMALTLPAAAAMAEGGATELRRHLEESGGLVRVGDREVDVAPLRDFYRATDYGPAWSGGREAQAERLLQDVQAVARAEGLSPESYAVPASASGLERDLMLSDALARFGRDLASGRVSPSRAFGGFGPETRPAFDPAGFLHRLAAGQDLVTAAHAMPPPYAGYQRLKAALERYRRVVLAGGWAAIPDGPSIKPGESDGRLAQVRQRLIASGDLAASHDKGRVLDAPLVEALKRFQFRHGLEADGAVGKQTLAALNVTAEQRLSQILVNLERWRWMPRRLDPVHVAVNLPAARLELVENGEVTMAMRVVVGDTRHPTPGLAATMNSVVLNPTWTVPPSIASREILPKLRKDPNYLVTNNMRILDSEADHSMDWSRYRGSRFPYRLRQQAGPDNALGQVKFNLRDSDDIYLHDTPNRAAFGRSYRALSHGCVRVERPLDLAEALLGDDWKGKLADAVATSDTRTLRLDRDVTVYLMYWTAWVDGDGAVHFRDDLYGHDGRLRAALKRAQPRPHPSQVAQDKLPDPL